MIIGPTHIVILKQSRKILYQQMNITYQFQFIVHQSVSICNTLHTILRYLCISAFLRSYYFILFFIFCSEILTNLYITYIDNLVTVLLALVPFKIVNNFNQIFTIVHCHKIELCSKTAN